MSVHDGCDQATDPIEDIVRDWSRERPELDASTIGIFGRLTRVTGQQRAIFNARHEESGLTLASFDVLANLRRSSFPHRKTAGQLADSSMLTTGGVTFRLDRMEAQNLLERVRIPEDRRVVYAQLTPHGKDVVDTAIATHLETQRQMVAGLTPAEANQLAMLLKKLDSSIAAYSRTFVLNAT